MKLKIKRLHPLAQLPRYMTPGAAGMDLIACEDAHVAPGFRKMIRLGFAMELEPGWEAQVRPRSGLAAKKGVTVLNTPGTVDSDYRGEMTVLLINHGETTLYVHTGDRVAQMVIAPAPQVEVVEVDELSDTARGTGGFGSTGVTS